MRNSFWTALFDLLAPRQCACCGRRLSVTEGTLCISCQLHLPLTQFDRHPQDNPMARLFWGIIPIEQATALFFYEPRSELAQTIYSLKYDNRPDIGRELGRMAAVLIEPNGFFSGIDAIVPVPLSRGRQWSRGYNQSKEIARGISCVTGLPVYDNVVTRRYFRQSQTHLSPWQRKANTTGVFRLRDARKISGKHLLLVDDIMTTGATLTALADELLKAPGVRFSIFTLGFTKS